MRGPQSALFGRNTIGGLVNVTSAAQDSRKWTGSSSVPFGNFSAFEHARQRVRRAHRRHAGGERRLQLRDARRLTVNDVTGDDLDSRDSFSGKGQLLWKPAANGRRAPSSPSNGPRRRLRPERPRGAARRTRTSRCATTRATPIATSLGPPSWPSTRAVACASSSTTGFVQVDDGGFDRPRLLGAAAHRPRQHRGRFPVHAGSPGGVDDAGEADGQRRAPLAGGRLPVHAELPAGCGEHDSRRSRRRCGFPINRVFAGFASSTTSASGSSARAPSPSRRSSISSPALRFDYENKDADLKTFYDPAIAPPTVVARRRASATCSPQFAAAYRVKPEQRSTAPLRAASRPEGSTRLACRQRSLRRRDDLELRRRIQGALCQGNRVALQQRRLLHRLERPAAERAEPARPGRVLHRQRRRRLEQGLRVRPHGPAAPGIDVFGTFGFTHATFSDGSTALGARRLGQRRSQYARLHRQLRRAVRTAR